MIRKATAILALVIGMTSPAWATGPLIDNSTNANAAAAASATGGSVGNIANHGGTHIQTNTQLNNQTSINTNTQGQQQGQGQYQGQGQGQSYEGQQHTNVNFEGTRFDRYAPPVAAPGLTSGGIGICLGSFSVGLTGPMAGVAFGKTTQDEGCARARDSMILHNMGHKGASLRVLAGESIKDAMIAEGILPAPKQAASKAPAPVEPVTVPSAAIFTEPVVSSIPASVQAN